MAPIARYLLAMAGSTGISGLSDRRRRRRCVEGREPVLLIRRGKPPREGDWSLPGGRQKLGETTRETAIRREVQRRNRPVEIELGHLLDVVDSA